MPIEAMGGYTWEQRDGVRPGLLCACYYTQDRPSPPGVHRHVNPRWVLDYSRTTVGRTRVGSGRRPWLDRGPNTAHLYPPNTPYWQETPATKKLFRGAYIIFTGGTEAGLNDLIPAHQHYARFLDPEGKIDDLLNRAASAGYSQGEAGFETAQAAMWEIFYYLKSAVYQSQETYLIAVSSRSTAKPSGLAARVDNYFRAHLAEKITLATLARTLHISPSLLSHRYTDQAGRPPMLALIELRIRLAKTLLLHGSKLSDIAAQTGFYDAYHLSKTFKKHTGLSPHVFLKNFDRSG